MLKTFSWPDRQVRSHERSVTTTIRIEALASSTKRECQQSERLTVSAHEPSTVRITKSFACGLFFDCSSVANCHEMKNAYAFHDENFSFSFIIKKVSLENAEMRYNFFSNFADDLLSENCRRRTSAITQVDYSTNCRICLRTQQLNLPPIYFTGNVS